MGNQGQFHEGKWYPSQAFNDKRILRGKEGDKKTFQAQRII